MFYAKKKLAAVLSAVMLLTSCQEKQDASDIITLKKPDTDKVQITISTKYSVSLNEFEKVVESQFPNVDLVQIGNYTANYSSEYAQQMANDDLTDIVLTWPLDADAQKCENELIDLAGMNFTSKYSNATLNSIAKDGKVYYLPGPTPLRGILYNKTMFEENNWTVPSDFDGFIQLCKQIEATGMRSLQLSFWNKEVLLYTFAGFGYAGSFSTPHLLQKLQNFDSGEGSFADFAIPALDSYERLIQEGILKPSDLEIRYPIREKLFYNRECAMISDSTAWIQEAHKAGNSDQFAVMPFFSPGKDGSWGQIIPVQYIGLNKNLEKPENKEKYENALDIMSFISTPEGQLALASGNTSWVSRLANSPVPDSPELDLMRELIKEGRFAVFPSYNNVDNAVYDSLAAMLRGEIDKTEVIQRIDAANLYPAKEEAAERIAIAEQSMSLMETGNFVCDILRDYAETDFALFLDNGKDGMFNAKGISARLYKGDVLETDVTQRVLPVLQQGEQGYMYKVTMTGENLIKTLEYSINEGGWFYYISGFKMEYGIYNKPGKRVLSIKDNSGKEIEPEKKYIVAILEGSVDETLMSSCEKTEIIVKDVILDGIKKKGTITPPNDGRLKFVLE